MIYIAQPDIKIEGGLNPLFILLKSPEPGVVLLIAPAQMFEKANTWLHIRIPDGNFITIQNDDGSVNYQFNCSEWTVARELVACDIASADIFKQIKIRTLQDSCLCSFRAVLATTRGRMPTLKELCTNHIAKHRNNFAEQLENLPTKFKEELQLN